MLSSIGKVTMFSHLLTVDYRANKINRYWPQVLFCVSFPFMLYKQYVNVVQFVQARKWIAQGDLEERRRSGSSRRRREE